jgi:hypothetical protein
MQLLKADTSTKVVIGPVVAVGDGFTPVTTLALGAADEAEILKHDAATITDISGYTFAAITSADGYYNLTIPSGGSDTEGRLTVLINDDSLCLPVRCDFMVVNANVFDSLYASATTDYLQIDQLQLGGNTQSSTDLKDFADAGYDPGTNKVQGVVLVDTTTTNTDMAGTDNAALASALVTAQDDLDILTGAAGAILDPDQSGVTIGTVNNVSGLVAGTGGISVAAESFTLTVGGAPTNSYTDTRTEDTTHHIIPPSGGNTDFYYQFDVGNAGVPQSVTWIGYAQSNGDSYDVYGYNYGTTTYEQIGTVSASNGSSQTIATFDLLLDHVGTGTNTGKVRLRVLSADGTNFATDRLFCTYTQAISGIPNGSTITLAASTTNENFVGNAWNLVLGGQTISGSYVAGAVSVSGTGVIANGNPAIFSGCKLDAITLSAYAIIGRTDISNTLTLTSTSGGSNDEIDLFNCVSGVSGGGSPTIDASGLTKTTSIQNRLYGGGCTYSINSFCTLSHESIIGGTITLTNAAGAAELRGSVKAYVVTSSGAATTNIVCTSGVPITINGTGGTVNVYGPHGGITDNSGAAVTINDLGADITDIPAILDDTNELQTDNVPGLIGALNNVAATDIVSAGAITTLSGAIVNVDLVDTTTTNTDMVGTDNAATASALATAQTDLDTITGAAGVLLDSTATSAQLVDDTWDEVLTSAAHNIAKSAGKRMRGIEEYQGYEGGFIYIDTVGGAAGTESYVNGTLDNPVSSIADANTLATALNITHFHVGSGSSITFAASQTNQRFLGENWTLAMGGQDIGGSVIEGANISGIGTSTSRAIFKCCDMDSATIPLSSLFSCGFSGDLVLGVVGTFFFISCYSGVAGTSTPSIDVGVALGNTNLNFRPYSGGIELKSLGQVGTDNVSIEGDGQVTINASCVGGTIALRGHQDLTGGAAFETAGGVISDDPRFDIDAINAALLSVVGAAGISLTDLGGMSTGMKAEINIEADTALTDYDGPTNAEMEARTFTAAQVAAIIANAETTPPVTFTGGTTTTAVLGNVDGSTASSVNDFYKGRIFVFNAGTLDEQATDVTAYDGATKTATITTITTAVTSGHTAIMC